MRGFLFDIYLVYSNKNIKLWVLYQNQLMVI